MAQIRLLELRNTYKWGGGPDKTILLSAEQHDRSRVSVVVAYIRDVRDREFLITEMARSRGLLYYEIPEKGKFDPLVVKAIRDIVVKHDINLIHSHDYKSDLFAYLVRHWLWRHPIALVSTAHAWVMLGLKGEMYRRLDLLLMRRFDHLIAVSKATKAEMLEAGVAESKISVIHNGIDTKAWSRERVTTTLREELNISSSTPVIGYVGRIMPEKDLVTWLRAAALVARKFPDARFVLVGEGRDSTTSRELQAVASTLGITEQVVFLGHRRNLLPVYSAFDIFVLSSLREGLPNSILEAMALGLPVVTTDVAGAKELVVNGETGFVVPQKDPEKIAKAVLAVLANKQIRRRMSQAGRCRVESEFSFPLRLKRVEDLYDHVLGLDSFGSSSSNPAVVY